MSKRLPESVLIIRMSAIGDVIHALPALDLLRQLLPQARIGWLVEELGAPLLHHHPHIDKLYVIPRKRWRRNFRKSFRSEMVPFYRGIRADQWEASLDFQGIAKSGIAAWACGASRRVGFSGENSRELNALFNRVRVRPDSGDRHVVQQNIRLLEGLGLSIPDALPRGTIRLLDSEIAAIRGKLTAVGWRGEKLLAINPGAGFITKRWPPGNFVQLAKALIARCGYRPIVLWGPGEEHLRDAVAAGLAGHDVITAPPTSVRELAVMVSLCSFFVGGDTGPTHLAGIFRVPVLSIFGATDAARNCPWPSAGENRAGQWVQRLELPCIACRKRTCPLEGDAHLACILKFPAERVLEEAEPWLSTVFRS
ncbi:glycosyltransferase family 9 protein [Candidatus Sumerlaeota bacterium]|nr:glycosyltransferase family 9 protein [Candidatus Sumerlaeota bacterium]